MLIPAKLLGSAIWRTEGTWYLASNSLELVLWTWHGYKFGAFGSFAQNGLFFQHLLMYHWMDDVNRYPDFVKLILTYNH